MDTVKEPNTRVLVTGASGQLGGYLLRELRSSGSEIVAWSGSRTGRLEGLLLQPVDLANADGVAAAFREARPSVVIHVAAMASIAECYRTTERAVRVNTHGTALMAELAARSAVRLVYVSTDLVFDGEKGWYLESDAPSPLSAYGRTKADAERAVEEIAGGVVARVSLMFGPTRVGRPSFFDQLMAALREHRPVTLFEDEWRTPLSLATAARALVAIAQSDYAGIVHVGGPERLSRLEMGQRLAAYLGSDPSTIVPASRTSIAAVEPRPRDVSLDSALCRELCAGLTWPRFEAAMTEMAAPV